MCPLQESIEGKQMTMSRVTVRAERHDRHQCPVEMAIEIPDDVADDRMMLRDETNGRVVPCQIRKVGGARKLIWMIEELPAEWERHYKLLRIESSPV